MCMLLCLYICEYMCVCVCIHMGLSVIHGHSFMYCAHVFICVLVCLYICEYMCEETCVDRGVAVQGHMHRHARRNVHTGMCIDMCADLSLAVCGERGSESLTVLLRY